MITDAHWICAYESLADRVSVSLEDFRRLFASAEAHPIDVDGEPAGILFVIGPEVHACPLEKHKGRWLIRKHLRVLSEVIRRHGHAITRATTPQGIEFVRRLGFLPEGGFFVLRDMKWDLRH